MFSDFDSVRDASPNFPPREVLIPKGTVIYEGAEKPPADPNATNCWIVGKYYIAVKDWHKLRIVNCLFVCGRIWAGSQDREPEFSYERFSKSDYLKYARLLCIWVLLKIAVDVFKAEGINVQKPGSRYVEITFCHFRADGDNPNAICFEIK